MPRKIKAQVGLMEKPQVVELVIPDQDQPVWDLDAKLKVVGQRVRRVEGTEKVTGRTKYTLDMTEDDIPGLLYGKVLRSPYPHARIEQMDATAAAALPGVKTVILFDKGHGFDGGNILNAMGDGLVSTPQDRVVLFAGEEIAAVAAESESIAEEAIRLIKVKYQQRPHVVDLEEARQPGAPRVHAGTQSNIVTGNDSTYSRGDIEQGFKEADVVLERTTKVPVVLHQSAECHIAIARWDGDKLTEWASTQGVNGFREELSKTFKIDRAKVRVITQHMGGGFGSKFGMQSYGAIAAALAKKAGAPVKYGYDRHEESVGAGNRPNATMWVKLGAKKDGTLTAIQARSYGTAGIGRDAATTSIMSLVYKCANVKLEDADVFTNAGYGMPFRAPGFPQGSFALESVMDELAKQLGMDPLELRRRNIPDAFPLTALDKIYSLGAEKIGWSRRDSLNPDPQSPTKRGMGMGTACWPNYSGPPAKSRVTISADGSVESAMAVQDLGVGTRTLVAMVTAEELGLTAEDIRVTIGDTSLELIAPDSGGSVTALSITPAIRNAAANARERLFRKVAGELGVPPEDLVAREGRIAAKNDSAKSLSWHEAAALIGPTPIAETGERQPNLDPYQQTPLWGAQFAEVEVDRETGQVRVERIVAVHDAGRALNPAMFENQVNGGVMMGVGYALLERRTMDKPEGRVVNPNLEDYKMLGPEELPEIETVMVEAITPANNVGGKGLGEPPVIPTAAAIANAVAHALGMRIYELPLSPDKVLGALAAPQEA
jgi:CO/xanthine dehydrogenase Mo-binding subunit